LLSWENIPLFSYLFLGGKCRTCHKKIPLHYTMVELCTALALLLIFNYHVNSLGNKDLFSEWHVLRDVFFLTILIVTFVYDYLYEEVLVRMTVMGIVIGFLINLFALHYSGWSMLLGMIIAAGFFLLQYLISRGRWIGGGDIWIGAMMGVWLGWQRVLVALFLAYILGAIVGVILLLTKKKHLGSALPFGVFLAVATFITIYYGNPILQWYLQMLR
jgi:prepilin signal peptidase PulO-like enzyme (type II secretory pathway)